MLNALTEAVRNARKEFDKLHATLSRMPAPKIGTVPRASGSNSSNSLDSLRRNQMDELLTELRKRL